MSTPAESPATDLLLPAATAMSAVTLHVADLRGTADYYVQALGLTELPRGTAPLEVAGGRDRDVVVLGHGTTPLQVLVHTPDLPPARPGQAGLFHTALLYPTRAALAATVLLAARHPASRYVGSADHLVSQAFYFTDPEGNGIELYWDRPRADWRWSGGRVQMDTLALDPQSFLRENLQEEGPQVGDVGHVHLKVGDVDVARGFYVGVLGFEVTADLGTALFVSAGGYHHHLGVNTWQSRGAGPRAATVGLGAVALSVPGREHLDALRGRLTAHHVAVADDGRTLRFRDPWGSLLEVDAVPV